MGNDRNLLRLCRNNSLSPREQAHLLSGINNELQPPLSPLALHLLIQMGMHENIVLFLINLKTPKK